MTDAAVRFGDRPAPWVFVPEQATRTSFTAPARTVELAGQVSR
ncbi:hypothetical protein [Kitasatospora sp. NRRL B-11411]|nr:hypothetical protein [Kitasatospora sp. NRRL B-11411]